MSRKEIHPGVAVAVIAVVAVIAAFLIYNGTSQKLNRVDPARMREAIAHAGMFMPHQGNSSAGLNDAAGSGSTQPGMPR